MTSQIRDVIAQNMRRPRGIFGKIVSKFVFDKVNPYLEQNAARLCRIQPHHKVLEVGFGSGHGLREAYSYVKDGPGVIYGIEYSELMLNIATRKMRKEIQKGKVDLSYGSVMQLPYNTDMFDSVFHCNSYYFWHNMKTSVQELHRVMKPGSTMVTTLNLDRIRLGKEKGLFKYGNTDPVHYMWALEQYGFEDITFEYMSDGDKKFQVIFARINEKQAYDEDFEEEVSSVSGVHSDRHKPTSVNKVIGHNEPFFS